MSDGIWNQLDALAVLRERPLDEVVRHHLLERVLRRLARLPDCSSFVLRGGMLARLWAGSTPRVAQDLDFVGTFPHDVEETVRRFRPVVEDTGVRDGVVFDAHAFHGRAIWEDTDFPGVRLFLRLGLGSTSATLTIDVGFNDPLVPPAELIRYPCQLGEPASVWATRPETAVGWKLHGLAEKGERRWRPKDLHDLLLIVENVPLHPCCLVEAIAIAFTSRGYTTADARAVLANNAWWTSKRTEVRWHEFWAQRHDGFAPLGLGDAIRRVAAKLQPALDRLP